MLLAACIILVVGLSLDNASVSGDKNDNNDVVDSYYQKATQEFERGKLRKMQMILAELGKKYPDENIQDFIDEKLSSLPVINASDLIDEYKTNEVACNLKYEGKLLKVTGNVTDIGQDILKTVYITLGDDNITFYDVRCEFEYEEELSQVANLREGYLITILCTYIGSVAEFKLYYNRFNKKLRRYYYGFWFRLIIFFGCFWRRTEICCYASDFEREIFGNRFR